MAGDVVVVEKPSRALLRYDVACRAIAKAKNLDEAKDIHDKAEALRAYARQAKNRQLEIDAAEIRIRAERRLGELIARQKETVGLNKGAKGSIVTGSQKVPVKDTRPTLSEAGIDKKLSSRAQQIARVPEDKFQGLLGEWRQRLESENERISTKLLRFGRELERERREAEEAETAKTVRPRFRVVHCAVEAVTRRMVADESVDAVITDPPYPEKYLSTFSSLGEFSARVLKPGGWCVVMTGAAFLPDVIRRLGEHLEYRWQYVVTTPGGMTNRNPDEGLFQAYKPVLIYQKPPLVRIREYWSDVITAKPGEKDKTLHKWQQSEAVFSELVKRFTVPGNLVADPFAGSGTTGRAAIAIGRHFWGCDVDEACATGKP